MGQTGSIFRFHKCEQLILDLARTEILISIADSTLTTGWLLSECIRKYEGRGNLVALRTARGIDILDKWLLLLDRPLSIFPNNERLLPVVERVGLDQIKLLGTGSFSIVTLCRRRETGELFAVKTIPKHILAEKRSQIRRERRILKKNECPFIVKFYDSYSNKKGLNLVLDFCPGGELQFHLRKNGVLSENQARFYFSELLLAFEWLHSQNIAYRDLKPENILLDIDGHIQLVDFGLSKYIQTGELSSSFCGCPEYISPEMLSMKGHGLEIDFYSMGALLYEMLTGLPPYYHPNRPEMYKKIAQSRLELEFPRNLGRSVKNLLHSLLQKNPQRRLGALRGISDIKAHPWLASVNWEQVKSKAIDPPFKPSYKESNFETVREVWLSRENSLKEKLQDYNSKDPRLISGVETKEEGV